MRNIQMLFITSFTFLLSGCAADSLQQMEVASSQLIGAWKSEPIETEIGPGHIHYEFSHDGRYSMHFETDLLRFRPRQGAYAVNGNRLITVGEREQDVSPFWFEDEDVLVIPDGSKIVRLNRM